MKDKVRLLPLPEAADRLGVTVSTIRAWIYRRSIEYVKIGRGVRISEATVERIIEQGYRPALEDGASSLVKFPKSIGRDKSVRIKTEQARRLQEIAEYVPGSSINALIQRAVEQWLEVEGPVDLDAFKKVKQKVKERQAVVVEMGPR